MKALERAGYPPADVALARCTIEHDDGDVLKGYAEAVLQSAGTTWDVRVRLEL